MNVADDSFKPKPWLYIGLAIALLACWWVGWRDYDPYMAQEAVRENIRESIRWTIQLFVQYLIPVGIVIFLVKRVVLNSRSKLRKS